MNEINIVGGGIAGLVAANACAEAGTRVTLREAHRSLGGRARTTAAPYIAHEGTHVFYCDGPHWRWLTERGLIGPAARVSWREIRGIRLRRDGVLRVAPPAGLVRMVIDRRRTAPVDRDFSSWAGEIYGPAASRAAANLLGVVTYDADPGRLSAAFVWERLLRVTAPRLPPVRYVIGGWTSVITRLAARARELGVVIQTGARVDQLPDPPVIVATELTAAQRLLADATLHWDSGASVLLDVGVIARRGDAFAVSDLDEAGFLERYSSPDPSLAPAGHSLIQAQMPLRPGESKADGLQRLERLVELGIPGWQERTTWRRDAVAAGRTGALDLPGRTWRDRPAINRGDGIFLAGDMVAAPGLLGEVSINSAIQAAHGAVQATGAGSPRGRQSRPDRQLS
ncbi:MAG: FAD-dependent oxidoreductase [Pseudonocardiales bacterium]|nr:FAD-dependent oxidoreductase [Actinomycetota bacterium]PZS12253.1 MAG: FAD-dependent oxidoreductase [Pseudonocardiales bacterium]